MFSKIFKSKTFLYVLSFLTLFHMGLATAQLSYTEIYTALFENLASAPTRTAEGMLYYNSTDKKFHYHNGTNFVELITPPSPQFTGNVALTDRGTLDLYEDDGNGSNYLRFQAPAAVTTTTTFTLPDGDGSSGDVLQTNGSGTLSFTTPSSGANPAGTMILFAGTSCPSGTLEANGSAVSRTTYADLYSALGDAWGEGDGSTTFRVPDLRGRFPRGHDDGATNDPDRLSRTALYTGGNTGDNVGSYQADAFDAHTHTVVTDNSTTFSAGSGGHYATSAGTAALDVSGSTGGNETRPLNAYVKFCVYY